MKDLLKQFADFQVFAAKRGLELTMALGAKYKLYPSPDRFDVSEEGVNMNFAEDTNHDCPDSESISLTIDELSMSDEAWKDHLEVSKQKAVERRIQAEAEKKKLDQQKKEQDFERLRIELGK